MFLVLLLASMIHVSMGANTQWDLKHAFSPSQDLSRRGSVELPPEIVGDGDDEVSVSQRKVSKAQWNELVEGCRSWLEDPTHGAGWYRLDAGSLGAWSIRACDLVRSRLKDEIMVTVVAGKPQYATGRAVLTHAMANQQPPYTFDETFPERGVWDTSVVFRLPSRGNSPRVDEAIAPEARTPEQKAAETKGQQGFLEKYWYILLPLSVYMIMQNMNPPPATQGGGNQAAATTRGQGR